MGKRTNRYPPGFRVAFEDEQAITDEVDRIVWAAGEGARFQLVAALVELVFRREVYSEEGDGEPLLLLDASKEQDDPCDTMGTIEGIVWRYIISRRRRGLRVPERFAAKKNRKRGNRGSE